MQRTNKKLSEQVREHAGKPPEELGEYEGNFAKTISTGSTLLDLAISGGRVRGGGIPGGIFVEVFGPSGAGKTVLLCEIAGGVQRAGGQTKFADPEARLDREFAKLFDVDVGALDYWTPDTVPEVFEPVREWRPKPVKAVHGIFADSLAALSTDLELEGKDAYGGRRAKEFSEELRKTCRTLKNENFLMVGSNQIRVNMDSGPFGEKWKSPGGEALGFYASLRLKMYSAQKLRETVQKGRFKERRTYGIETKVQVYKSSLWKPFRTASLIIDYDYGIDDIQTNLQFVKDVKKESVYTVNEEKLAQSMDESIEMVEADALEMDLRNEVIDLWEEMEEEFARTERKPKLRG
jgi:protein RecA